MTDRELLELAAKAAEIDLVSWTDMYDACDQIGGRFITRPRGEPWNPLEDDGDALRLAVALRMSVEPWGLIACAVALINNRAMATEPHYGDAPERATRRAIVRAAAEIGKGMK